MIKAPARQHVTDGIDLGQGAAQRRQCGFAGEKRIVKLAASASVVAIPERGAIAFEQGHWATTREDQALGLDLRFLGEHGLIFAIAKANFDTVARQDDV
jgi:hypothetical protein